MNDEEKNAILRLWKISCVLENSIEKAKYDKKYSEEVPIEEYIEEKEAIEIVLNLIEKQKQQISNLETAGQALEKVYKAEIEKQKERIEYLERSISRKEHSLVGEEQDNVELETKLQEKDKIIDEMANYIIIHHQVKTMKKTFCKNCTDCKGIVRDCIKEYFENKVKEVSGMPMYSCENKCLCATCKRIYKNCAECKTSVDKTNQCLNTGIRKCEYFENKVKESK